MPVIEALETRRLMSADFNGDGINDFVYRDTTTGEVTALLLRQNRNSLATQPIATVPNQAWQIVDVDDYDGDGDGDLLWRNSDTGRLLVWRMDGRRIEGFRTLPSAASSWAFAASAEKEGTADGTHDLLWHNADDGRMVLWIMNGRDIQQTVQLSRETNRNWQVVGMSRVRGEPLVNTEILWRNRVTGENRMWRIEGGRFRVAVELKPVGPAYRIGGFIGQDAGSSQIFWQNTANGQVVQWVLASNQVIEATHLYAFDPDTNRLLIAGG